MLPRERLPETPINTLEDFCRFILGDQGTRHPEEHQNPKCAVCNDNGVILIPLHPDYPGEDLCAFPCPACGLTKQQIKDKYPEGA